MSVLFRHILSRLALKKLSKTPGPLDYTKAIGNVTSLFGSLTTASSSEVQIPPPQSEKPRIKTDIGATDEEIEAAIGPLCDYLNENLQVLNSTLSDSARETVMAKIWKEILIIIEGLLVPPLGDTPSSLKPLPDRELDIAFKWLRASLSLLFGTGLMLPSSSVPLKLLPRRRRRNEHGGAPKCKISRDHVPPPVLRLAHVSPEC